MGRFIHGKTLRPELKVVVGGSDDARGDPRNLVAIESIDLFNALGVCVESPGGGNVLPAHGKCPSDPLLNHKQQK